MNNIRKALAKWREQYFAWVRRPRVARLTWWHRMVYAVQRFGLRARAKRLSLLRAQRLLNRMPSWWGDVTIDQLERLDLLRRELDPEHVDYALLMELSGFEPHYFFDHFREAELAIVQRIVSRALGELPRDRAVPRVVVGTDGVRYKPLSYESERSGELLSATMENDELSLVERVALMYDPVMPIEQARRVTVPEAMRLIRTANFFA